MALTASAAAQTALRIGRITINALPVFNEVEASHGSFYRGANLLHVQTRPALLRRFLLFKQGDPYDPAKIAETERNLRLFDFLKSASITASEPHDGTVDINIVTQDALTTDVNGDFSNDGGTAAYDFDVTQKDLFGSGSELELHLDKGIERRANSIEFLHPAVFGPYWNLDTLFSRNSDGNEEKLQLDRPLFSYTTPWTMSFLFDHVLRNERYFQLGEVAARFRQEHRQLSLFRSHVLHADENGSSSLVGGFDLLDDSFSRLPGREADLLPSSRHFRFLDAGYESTGFRYVKLDYIDRDLREQDFNLGHSSSVHAGISPGRAGHPTTARFRASESAGHAFSDHSFVVGQISASSRTAQNRNSILSADLRSITRFYTRYPQAFVSQVRVDMGRNLDRDVQFFADGQNGLRAYPNFAFEGSRRVVVNAEYRLFLGHELLQIFGPGAAIFADAGYAADRAFGLRDMKSDAGFGLRIGVARLNSALLRFDLAWALNPSPLNRRGMVLSISTVHAF